MVKYCHQARVLHPEFNNQKVVALLYVCYCAVISLSTSAQFTHSLSHLLFYLQNLFNIYKQTSKSAVCVNDDYATGYNTAVVQFCSNKSAKFPGKSWHITERFLQFGLQSLAVVAFLSAPGLIWKVKFSQRRREREGEEQRPGWWYQLWWNPLIGSFLSHPRYFLRLL